MDYMDDAYIYLAVVYISDIYIFSTNIFNADIFILSTDIYNNPYVDNTDIFIFTPQLSII